MSTCPPLLTVFNHLCSDRRWEDDTDAAFSSFSFFAGAQRHACTMTHRNVQVRSQNGQICDASARLPLVTRQSQWQKQKSEETSDAQKRLQWGDKNKKQNVRSSAETNQMATFTQPDTLHFITPAISGHLLAVGRTPECS